MRGPRRAERESEELLGQQLVLVSGEDESACGIQLHARTPRIWRASAATGDFGQLKQPIAADAGVWRRAATVLGFSAVAPAELRRDERRRRTN